VSTIPNTMDEAYFPTDAAYFTVPTDAAYFTVPADADAVSKTGSSIA
jgi:hypothetical protein